MNEYKFKIVRWPQLIGWMYILCIGCGADKLPLPSEMENNYQEISETQQQDLPSEYHILFIGNSLTYTNNLPELVGMEGAKNGISLGVHSIAKPNYAIVDHWSEGEVQGLINTGKYDYVIIQQGPSSQEDGYDMLVNEGKKYAEICEANGSELAYFMVWPSMNYYHTFDGVIGNYSAGARANKAILCPVGLVWKNHFEDTGDFSYYGPDGFHPSLKGSQIAAEVILSSLFNID
ncbi:SGNH/GDSL hydrolase family protein [Flagellimonas sp. S174]|uniref:SGNH/GDSL hydrolase family protein n=1 Tax=Flagellimonas sp. S174 TaxID=3410790 RepID=UPI003BF4DA0D